VRSHLKARTQRRKRLNVRRIYYNVQMERDPGAFSCSMFLLCPTDGLHITAQIPLPPSTANPFPPIKPSVPLASVFNESPLRMDCYLPVRVRHRQFQSTLYIASCLVRRHLHMSCCCSSDFLRAHRDRLTDCSTGKKDTNAKEITSYLSVSLRSLRQTPFQQTVFIFLELQMPQRDVPIDD